MASYTAKTEQTTYLEPKKKEVMYRQTYFKRI